MMNKALFSSNRKDWETPQELFNSLNSEFHFTLDAAANQYNHKCSKYYTAEDNGLLQDWSSETVFINPPYGNEIKAWVRKAYYQNHIHNNLIVMLLPARTDTQWFHTYINNHAEIRFLKGRIKFVGAKHPAPFPSMVVIFRPRLDSIPDVDPNFDPLMENL